MSQHVIQLGRPLRNVRLLPSPESTDATSASHNSHSQMASREAAFPPRQSGQAQDTELNERGNLAWDIEPLKNSLEQIAVDFAELESKRRNSLRELQAVAVELAVELAERLVHTTVDAQAHDLVKLLQALLQRAAETRPLVIRWHPSDWEQLQSAMSEDELAHYARDQIVFKADARVAKGNATVDLPEYRLQFDWHHQLSELRQNLLNELEHAQTERRTSETSDQGIQRFPDRRETA